MNKLSGFFAVNIDGQLVKFKFGLNAFVEFCRIRNIELAEFDKVMNADPVSAMRDMLYCANYTASLSAGETPYFANPYTVGDLLDTMPELISMAAEALGNARAVKGPAEQSPAPKKKRRP